MNGYSEEFCAAIKQRGLNITSLAAMAFTGRAHLGQVLNGRREGSKTWKRLKRVLSSEEYGIAWEYAQRMRTERGSASGEETKMTMERLRSLD